jgi:cation efflux system membrane fusion protein
MPSAFMTRILQFSASLALVSAALLGSLPPASAHVGHGDEFQQQGAVRQVKANADTDALLGVMTEKPQQGPDGLTVPAAAVVDADGKSLVFVKTASTYDPVVVETGSSTGDRIVISKGIAPSDAVVVQGALSLYAESKKTQQEEPSATTPGSAAADKGDPAGADSAAAASGANPLTNPGLIAAGVAVLAAGGFAATRLGRKDS